MLKQPPLDVSKIPDIAGGDSGTTDRGILLRYRDNPLPVIPGLPRDLDLFRDLFKKAVMLKQPPLDVSKIPDIAGGDSGTTVLWFLRSRISLGRFRDDG